MEGEKSRVMECTTTNFNGCVPLPSSSPRVPPRPHSHHRGSPPRVISEFDPNTSWSAKWLRLGASVCVCLGHRATLFRDSDSLAVCSSSNPGTAEKLAPGCYALSVTEKLSPAILSSLED